MLEAGLETGRYGGGNYGLISLSQGGAAPSDQRIPLLTGIQRPRGKGQFITRSIFNSVRYVNGTRDAGAWSLWPVRLLYCLLHRLLPRLLSRQLRSGGCGAIILIGVLSCG
jgi:hypothetical protein